MQYVQHMGETILKCLKKLHLHCKLNFEHFSSLTVLVLRCFISDAADGSETPYFFPRTIRTRTATWH